MIKIQIPAIKTMEILTELFEKELVFVHKLSPRCPISFYAESEIEKFVSKNGNFEQVYIDVVQDRKISQAMAERVEIKHESPQSLLIINGKVVWAQSHGEITLQSLEQAVEPYTK